MSTFRAIDDVPSPPTRPDYLLRGVLVVVGAMIVLLGLNVGLGGIRTLGWQGGTTAFFEVTDPDLFAVRDSHVRFIGGVWLGVGLIVLTGAFVFRHLRGVLIAMLAMIAIGGVARFSGDASLLATPAILPSLGFELLLAPLLAIWIGRAERRARRSAGFFNASGGR